MDIVAGACDLGKELRSAIPSAVCMSDTTPAAHTVPAAPVQPAAPPNVPHSVLNSFAASHGVEPGSILGNSKRSSSSSGPAGHSKRPCTSPNEDIQHETRAGSQGSRDAVLAGMAAARRGAPAKSALSLLAEQLEPGAGAGASQSQASTQMLQLTQGRLPALAPHPLPPVAVSNSRCNSARRRRQPQRAATELSKVWLSSAVCTATRRK
jgi:hypothetical protein